MLLYANFFFVASPLFALLQNWLNFNFFSIGKWNKTEISLCARAHILPSKWTYNETQNWLIILYTIGEYLFVQWVWYWQQTELLVALCLRLSHPRIPRLDRKAAEVMVESNAVPNRTFFVLELANHTNTLIRKKYAAIGCQRNYFVPQWSIICYYLHAWLARSYMICNNEWQLRAHTPAARFFRFSNGRAHSAYLRAIVACNQSPLFPGNIFFY